MKKLLIVFFSLLLINCANKPERPMPFEGRWTMMEIVPGEMSGCLSASDVVKLREYQYQCEEVKACE